jgi:hypothetical protein
MARPYRGISIFTGNDSGFDPGVGIDATRSSDPDASFFRSFASFNVAQTDGSQLPQTPATNR